MTPAIACQVEWGLWWHAQAVRYPEIPNHAQACAYNANMNAMQVMALEALS